MKWQPIIKGEEAQTIITKLAEIAAHLKETIASVKNIALFSGKTGIALFFFYYAAFMKEETYADLGYNILEDVFDRVPNQEITCTFSNGLAGIGWAFEHLARNRFIEADTDELLSGLDGILHEAMQRYLSKGEYDLLHGALGQGIYFLNRSSDHKLREYLDELVSGLDEIGIIDQNTGGMKWRSVLDSNDGTRGFDPGLSHGTASIIFFLSRMASAAYNNRQASILLEKSTRFLLGITLEPEKYLSIFPIWLSEKEEPESSRLAWCYGDLGIGSALLQAGKTTHNKVWEKKALEILLHSSGRRQLHENYVFDAGLCHGTAGIAHIYNRVYHTSSNATFKDAARYWFTETMKMPVFEDGAAGFKAFYGRDSWVSLPGFLEGAAGIGLALISAVSDIEPMWDRCLLLS